MFTLCESWIFKSFSAAAATVTATAAAVAAATASAANKTWILKRFYDSAMPAILEIWIFIIFSFPIYKRCFHVP